MDYREAIWRIKDHRWHYDIDELFHPYLNEALNMAIEALAEKHNCEKQHKNPDNVYSWAEHEVELAKENGDEYYNHCLDAALEAYRILCDRGHSGNSISVTKSILNCLIEQRPLSPIFDTPDVWSEVGQNKYQCNRYSALFKDVNVINDEEHISYHDVDRFVCYEEESDIPFHNGFISKELHKMFPISLPYYPERFKVIVKEELFNPDNGDFDTITIIKVIKPNGDTVNIQRYFTEKEHKLVEISYEEYKKMQGIKV